MLKLDDKYVGIHIFFYCFVCFKFSIIKSTLLFVNALKLYKKGNIRRINLATKCPNRGQWLAVDGTRNAYYIIKTY